MTVRKRTLAHLAGILAGTSLGGAGCGTRTEPATTPPGDVDVAEPPTPPEQHNIVCDPMPPPAEVRLPPSFDMAVKDASAVAHGFGPQFTFLLSARCPPTTTYDVKVTGGTPDDAKPDPAEMRVHAELGTPVTIQITFRDGEQTYTRSWRVTDDGHAWHAARIDKP